MLALVLLAALLLLEISAPSVQARTRGKEFRILTAGSEPYGIAAGPDGNCGQSSRATSF